MFCTFFKLSRSALSVQVENKHTLQPGDHRHASAVWTSWRSAQEPNNLPHFLKTRWANVVRGIVAKKRKDGSQVWHSPSPEGSIQSLCVGFFPKSFQHQRLSERHVSWYSHRLSASENKETSHQDKVLVSPPSCGYCFFLQCNSVPQRQGLTNWNVFGQKASSSRPLGY